MIIPPILLIKYGKEIILREQELLTKSSRTKGSYHYGVLTNLSSMYAYL